MGRHSVPVHEHDLIVAEKVDGDGEFKCGGCTEKEMVPGQIYYWCNLCSSHFHERCAKLPLQIKYFFHPCPIFLRLAADYYCSSCYARRSNVFAYRCERCDFIQCVECTLECLSFVTASGEREGEGEGEKILHCCHPHPLQLLSLEPKSSLLSCPVCNMPCSLGGVGRPIWGCEQCNLHLHKSCLDFLPQIVHMKFPSKSTSWVMQTVMSCECSDCEQAIDTNLVFRKIGGKTNEYLCISCCLVRKLIDESYSSQISKVINHFFHPCSDLKLILSPFSTCNACFQSHHHFSYHCESCDFFLCFDCAQLPQLASQENEANELVQHFCHWHPLKLFTGTQETHLICNLCEVFCSEPYYSCNDQCHFYIHKSCMDSLPHKTNHRLLSQTLVLRTIQSFKCTTCSRQCSGLTFYCSDRKCKFCVKCVLWPQNELGDDGRFTSARHWHQLSLCETEEEHKVSCFLCKECCIGRSYKCIECDFFFHKVCAELPTELVHPIHPQHNLKLTNRSSSDPKANEACELCWASLPQKVHPYDWFYSCHQCDFQLDIQCASCMPSIKYEGHPHLLYVVVNMHGDIDCQTCSKSCEASSALLCPEEECDFSFHLHCGPLPRTIKHSCHVHPLVLQDYYVEDNISDEFACHVCEKHRDPRLRVYYCSRGCFMICDVKCATSEVVPLLQGEHGEVELTTTFPQVACRVINSKSFCEEMKLVFSIERDGAGDGVQKTKHVFSNDDLFDSFSNFGSEEEENLCLGILEEDKEDDMLRTENEQQVEAPEETSSISEESSGTDTSLNEEVESYSFSFKALLRFKNILHAPSVADLKEGFLYGYDGSIMTGTYALPEILGPIYEEFFGMYNIIDHKCKSSYAQKRALIFVTCAVLHQMRMTKVVDVEKDTISQWLGWMRYVKKCGRFNVGCVAENIKQVWRAHYYIQSKKIVDDKSSQLREGIEQESRIVEELRTKLAEAEARLEELQLKENEHDTYRVVGSRGPMKRERTDALEIKWRTCYESLITLPGNMPAK